DRPRLVSRRLRRVGGEFRVVLPGVIELVLGAVSDRVGAGLEAAPKEGFLGRRRPGGQSNHSGGECPCRAERALTWPSGTKRALHGYEPSLAELVIVSRKRLDIDGPKSVCQSANFQMAQWVRTISVARTA